MLKTLGGLRLEDAPGKPYTYRAVRSLLLVCYVADQYMEGKRQHKRDTLAKLLWPQTKNIKNRKNNLSVALKNLREALVGAEVLRTCEDSDPYDPSLELNLESISLTSLNSQKLVTVDFAVCEAACVEHDLVTVAEVYRGVFLAGVEKRAQNIAAELLTWLQDKRSSLASTVLEACLEVLQDHTFPQAQRDAAQGLLERLSEHDPEVFIAPSLLADAHAYLPAAKQAELAQRLLATFQAEAEIRAYMPILMAMALQHEPDFDVACRVQPQPLMGARKASCKQFLEDGDWWQSVEAAANVKQANVKQAKYPRTRLRGRAFWQRQAVAEAQHVLLLQRLWHETPDQPEKREELFYLAWHYHQGVSPATAPRVALQGQHGGEVSLEQRIRTNLATINSEQAARVTQGMGNFVGFGWDKLTRVFLYRAQQASRMERFGEVLALCDVWEQARQQHGEAQHPQMVWYAAYALERQGDYGTAEQRLEACADVSDVNVSDHHRALRATLQFRVGQKASAKDSAKDIVRSLLTSHDVWARAEAHSLIAKEAYLAEDFTVAIDHYACAKLAWLEADEPCRAIAAEASVASCYDCRAQTGDVKRANDIYDDLNTRIVRQGLPPVTGMRTRLNQLMLWDYHQLKTPEDIRQGFTALTKALEQQDISKEVLGKAWYNFGQHYYRCFQAYADARDGLYVDIHHSDLHQARVCYEKALEALKGSRDRVMYALVHGELGRICQLQDKRAQAEAALHETIDILSHAKQQSLLAEYQQLLAQGDAGENFGHEPGAV